MRILITTDNLGNWRWKIRNIDGDVVAMSPGSFDGEEEARRAVKRLLRKAPPAPIVTEKKSN